MLEYYIFYSCKKKLSFFILSKNELQLYAQFNFMFSKWWTVLTASRDLSDPQMFEIRENILSTAADVPGKHWIGSFVICSDNLLSIFHSVLLCHSLKQSNTCFPSSPIKFSNTFTRRLSNELTKSDASKKC